MSLKYATEQIQRKMDRSDSAIEALDVYIQYAAHLEAMVDDLNAQLSAAKERLNAACLFYYPDDGAVAILRKYGKPDAQVTPELIEWVKEHDDAINTNWDNEAIMQDYWINLDYTVESVEDEFRTEFPDLAANPIDPNNFVDEEG